MTVIKWKGKSAKDLRALPAHDQKTGREKVNDLASYPNLSGLDVIKLTDKGGWYRLRVGNYRVMFEIISGETAIIEIERILRRTSKRTKAARFGQAGQPAAPLTQTYFVKIIACDIQIWLTG